MRHVLSYNLFEFVANPYNWNWEKLWDPASHATAKFYSEDDRYFVLFTRSKNYEMTYSVTFESDKHSTSGTGFGNVSNAMRVLATVLDIIIAFLDDNPEYSVEFVGVKDEEKEINPSRRDRVYKMMMKDLPDSYKWEIGRDGRTIRIKKNAITENANWSNDKILDEFLSKISEKNKLYVNPLRRSQYILNDEAIIELDRFDKGNRREISIGEMTSLSKGKGIGSKTIEILNSVADELKIDLTLYAKPFGRDGLSKKDLIMFYKKKGFETVPDQYGMDDAKEIEDYVYSEESEGLNMIRKHK